MGSAELGFRVVCPDILPVQYAAYACSYEPVIGAMHELKPGQHILCDPRRALDIDRVRIIVSGCNEWQAKNDLPERWVCYAARAGGCVNAGAAVIRRLVDVMREN